MKSFEDKFMDIQIGLVSLAMEYIEGHADKVFLYCINEKGMINFNVFYRIGTNYSLIHDVNKYLEDEKKVDVSNQMQILLLRTGNQDLLKLSDLSKEYDRKCPSEMWLIYDVNEGTLDTKYSYEERYEKDEYLQSRSEFKKWFEEVKSKNV